MPNQKDQRPQTDVNKPQTGQGGQYQPGQQGDLNTDQREETKAERERRMKEEAEKKQGFIGSKGDRQK